MSSFEPLRPLANNVFLHEPRLAEEDRRPRDDPPLIILCTWVGGASPRHINKYVASYMGLYPGSCLLLITTHFLDISVRSFSAVRERLKPARNVIRRILGGDDGVSDGDSANAESRQKALLHVFSHGGCNTAVQLALSMSDDHDKETKNSGLRHLPLRAVIFDSCPGDDSFLRMYNAAAVSFPQTFPLEFFESALLYPSMAAVFALQRAGLMNSVRRLRQELNDRAVFGSARRLYLYSKVDDMVPWDAVQRHVEEARRLGYWPTEAAGGNDLTTSASSFSPSPMDLLSVLPDFPTKPYAHILPPLERASLNTVDLITLDALEIAKRAHVPPADVRRLSSHVVKALHHDVGFEESAGPDTAEPSSSINFDAPLTPGSFNRVDLSQWSAISTLDPALDALLAGGGIPTGYVTEVTGESASGKTQFLLTLLLSVQLPSPRGLGKSAIYISTEAPLSTPRLSQLLDCHPYLSTLPRDEAPSLQNVLSINAMDLETQDHILNYQLPVAIGRYNVGLVVIDSITSNYRAEHTSTNIQGLTTRSWELARLGQLLRNLAAKEGIAIVVANQVSDRFEGPEGLSNPFFRNAMAGANANSLPSTPHPHPHSQQHLQPPPSSNRDVVASPLPLPRHRPPESGNIELAQHNVIFPSSSPAFPSSPYTNDDDWPPPRTQQQQQQQQNFDGSYLVGNPVRNEILSLMHQQRFFTGWGDDLPQSLTGGYFPGYQKPAFKTPALGMVWLTQIACRITLKKEDLPVAIDPVFDLPTPHLNVNQNISVSNPDASTHPAATVTETRNGEGGETENKKHDDDDNKAEHDTTPSNNTADQIPQPELPSNTVPLPTEPESTTNSEPVAGPVPPPPPPTAPKPPTSSSQYQNLFPPSSPLPPPDRPIRRTIKLVFAPWTAGKAVRTGDIQDEVEFTIEKGGMRGVL
ncbi:DNA repair protein rhp57 [Aspergillus melleus]|uniref:DNA repair protein rhp57 n=1 Tax=Aspergillus melleus TaxID=138277 RepID=A0ACC3ASJ2_9EURO|nr:DNA repair protein rhp57 [Aspergillus melleus]